MTLSLEELERYARHIVLPEIGGPGQQALARARILVVGAGGLGAPALLYLAAAGVGTLVVVDDDAVALSNLQRQPIFSTADISRPKAETAARRLTALNPHVTVEPLVLRLDSEAASRLVPSADLLLDGSDNFATRYLLNAACVAAGRPLVAAAMSRWEGQISLWHPAAGGPCYACVFPEPPDPSLTPPCSLAGVVGALPGVMGSLMAMEAIKHLTGAGRTLRSALLLYDALDGEMRRVRTRSRADCPVCSGIGTKLETGNA